MKPNQPALIEPKGEVLFEEGVGRAEKKKERPVIEETYVAIPVKVVLDIDSRYLLEFLRRLLKSPWRYNIHKVECSRIPKEKKRYTIEGKKKERRILSPREQMFANTAVRVTMYLEALDFTPLMRARAKAATGEG